MQGRVGKIPPGNSRGSLFTTFPWLAAAKVLCGLLASMDTFSFATAFAELLRDFRKKSFANQSKNPHPESWLGVQPAPLDYNIYSLGSILYLPKQFRGSSLHLGKSEIKPLKPPHQDKRSLFLSSNKHLFSQAQEKCGVLCCNTGGVCNSQSLRGPFEGLLYINTHTLSQTHTHMRAYNIYIYYMYIYIIYTYMKHHETLYLWSEIIRYSLAWPTPSLPTLWLHWYPCPMAACRVAIHGLLLFASGLLQMDHLTPWFAVGLWNLFRAKG